MKTMGVSQKQEIKPASSASLTSGSGAHFTPRLVSLGEPFWALKKWQNNLTIISIYLDIII